MNNEKKSIGKKNKRTHGEHKNIIAAGNSDLPGALGTDLTRTAKMSSEPAAPLPFLFLITIAINPAIVIKSVNLEGVMAKKEDFKQENGNIICKIEAGVSTFTFVLIIEAEGDPDTLTTFNLTCDDKKVFETDQEIIITSTGRGGFTGMKIPLP